MIHQQVHPDLDVDGCFGCRIASVGITPSALGSSDARAKNHVEKQWDADIPAYRRLRANGVQPRRIDGAAVIEARANTVADVQR